MREPFICLNMIVKNEAHVIKRCLDSVVRHIDNWVIVDTGSTDGTQQIIRDYFASAGKPGELHERPWKNFGHNRSEALDLARSKARYTMFIDADEVFEVPAEARLPELTADAYGVLHAHRNIQFSHWRTQFVRNALPWRWEGVLHEAVVCHVPHRWERLEVGWTHELFDSARNALPQEEKYSRDAAVLEEALKTEPDNARYVFYLAQSWRDAKQPEKALEHYRRRASMPGWEEEGWYAQYQTAKLLEQLGRRAEAVDAYLGAFERRPTRAEPLCDLARMHRQISAFHVAHLFAAKAKTLPKPTDVLFLDDSAYGWRALDEEAVACYWLGLYAESAAICAQLLEGGQVPESQRARIEANRRLADQRLGGSAGAVADPSPPLDGSPSQAAANTLLERSLTEYTAGRFAACLEWAEQALKLAPQSAEAYNNIAVAQIGLGHFAEAIAAAETAVALKPGFDLAKNNLNWAKEEQRKAQGPK